MLFSFLLACTLSLSLCIGVPRRTFPTLSEIGPSEGFTAYYQSGDILIAGVSPLVPGNPLVRPNTTNEYFAIRSLAWIYAVEQANKELLLPSGNFSLGIAIFNVGEKDYDVVGDVTIFMATRSVNFCWLWPPECSTGQYCESTDRKDERVPVFLNPGYTSQECKLLEHIVTDAYCSAVIGNRFGTPDSNEAMSLEAVALCSLLSKLDYSNVIVALIDDEDVYTSTIAKGMTIEHFDPTMFCPLTCMTVYWYNISVVEDLCQVYDRCVLVVLASHNGALKFFSTFTANHRHISNLQIIASSGWAGQQYALTGFEPLGENTIGIVPRLTRNEQFFAYLQKLTLDDVRDNIYIAHMIAEQNNCSLAKCTGTEKLVSIDTIGFGVAQHDIDSVIELAKALLRVEKQKCSNESERGEKLCDSFLFFPTDGDSILNYWMQLRALGFGALSLVQYQKIDDKYVWTEVGTYTNETDGWNINATLFRSGIGRGLEGKPGWIIDIREQNIDPTTSRCTMSVFTFSWFTTVASWFLLVFGVLLTLTSLLADIVITYYRRTPIVRFAFPGYAMTLSPSVSAFIFTGFFVSIASLDSAGCITVSTLLSLLIANILATMNAKLLLFQRHTSLHKTLDHANSDSVNVFHPFSFCWIAVPMVAAVTVSVVSTVVLATSTDKMKVADEFFVTIRQTTTGYDMSTICVSLTDKLALLADVPTYALLAAVFFNATRAKGIQFVFMLKELRHICAAAAAIVVFQLMTTATQFTWSTVEGIVMAKVSNVFFTGLAVLCLIKLPIVYLLLFNKEKNTPAYVKEVASRRTSRGLGGVFVIQRLEKFDRDESK